MNYEEALNYIHSLQVFGSVPGLERIEKLLEALGNPQDDLRFIHVAGTNGKGSTCTMLYEIYRRAGLKVGLYTSPYVIDFRERIQLDGEYISKSHLAELVERVRATGVYVTEFEFITALAFLYYKEQGCDLVILEVGLGGRFDATNIIKKPLCAVITRIDLDHTDYLGSTYGEIAGEKCGIIKDDCNTVVYPLQQEEVLPVVRERAPNLIIPSWEEVEVIRTGLHGNEFIYKGQPFKTRLVGNHQIANALTAIETARAVGMATEQSIADGIAAATLPARVELLNEEPIVLLDGSHNPNGADALADFLKDEVDSAVAVIGMMADKDCRLFLQKILPFCKSVITVCVRENKRSISAEELALMAAEYCPSVHTAEDYDSAIELAAKIGEGKAPVLVCGSLYLACSVREKLISYFK